MLKAFSTFYDPQYDQRLAVNGESANVVCCPQIR